MRRNLLAAILVAVAFTVLAPPPASASVSWSVSISYFHESLAPYGRWVVSEPYGEVWVPSRISSGWDPYWNGEWIWTDYGWTWVSYDPWGDIPYHYGTWVWVDNGWAWEPGTVWAPAWVTWAWTDDYIGWAPVSSSFFITASGYSGPAVVVAPTRYVFVPATQFVGVNVSTARVPQTQNATILSSAQKGTRFTVSGGVVRATADPPPSFVERVTGKRLQKASLGKLKAGPTTLAAAHVSGRRIGVVTPARERSAAITGAKANGREMKAARATRTRETRVAGAPARAKSGGARMTRETRETRGKQRAVSPARVRAGGKSKSGAVRTHATVHRHGTTTRSERAAKRPPTIGKANHRTSARKEAVHKRVKVHREAARSASARGVSRRAEHLPKASTRPAPVYRHEARQQRVRQERAALPPREKHAAVRSSATPHVSAPSPATHGNPHGVPPARAAQSHAPAPPQPVARAPKGKEKKEGG
ncbi:MAG TPA: DUF6600 domain-containing protein [Thermoanaerobaculia bacterium]